MYIGLWNQKTKIMETTKWQFDPMHSELRFKVKHLMIASVSGSFRKFDIQMESKGEDFTTATLNVSAEVNSITTGNEQRDAHLRNGDFFDADNYPTLEFNSTSVEKTGQDNFTVYGNLILKGISKPVQLDVEYSGLTKDPWGNERAGFEVSGKIRRSDWGMTFNSVLETGGVALGDEVKIKAEVQMIYAPAAVLTP